MNTTKKLWTKPELTSLIIQGVTCGGGVSRNVKCGNETPPIPSGTISCGGTKNKFLS